MKNLILFTLIYIAIDIPFFSKAQGVSLRQTYQGDIIALYASNSNFAPYQCEILLKDAVEFLENIKDTLFYFVIPAQTKDRLLFKVRLLNAQATKLTYTSGCHLGDPTTTPDSVAICQIPYEIGRKYKVIQSYFGKFSHKNQHAIDFKLPEGTPICAANTGVVIKVKEDSDKGGRKPTFSDDANRITIYHADGTLAEYMHLRKDGALVAVGDTVRQGQVIGYSGNTGWSTTPHLHFVVKTPVRMGYKTIPTLFRGRKGIIKRIWAGRKYRAY
jgi:murein DD-endopeptidase MepM/ murein hydrolase activator NlpD